MNSLKIIGITTLTLLASAANAANHPKQTDYGPTLKLDYDIASKAYQEYTPIGVTDRAAANLETDGVVVPITRGCVSKPGDNTLFEPTTTMNIMGKLNCAKMLSTFPTGEMTQSQGKCIAQAAHPALQACEAIKGPSQTECDVQAQGSCASITNVNTACGAVALLGPEAVCTGTKTVPIIAIPEVLEDVTYTFSADVLSGGKLEFNFDSQKYAQNFVSSATITLGKLVDLINTVSVSGGVASKLKPITASFATGATKVMKITHDVGTATAMVAATSTGSTKDSTTNMGAITKTAGTTGVAGVTGVPATACDWTSVSSCTYLEDTIGKDPNYDSASGDITKYTDATGCGCLVSYTFHPPSKGVIGCAQSVVWYNSARDHIVGTVAAALNAKSTSISENYDLEQLQKDAAQAISDAHQVTNLCSELKTSLQIKRNTYHAYNSAWSDMSLSFNAGFSIPALKGTRNRNREIPQEKILAHALGQGHDTEVLMNLLTLA